MRDVVMPSEGTIFDDVQLITYGLRCLMMSYYELRCLMMNMAMVVGVTNSSNDGDVGNVQHVLLDA